MNTEIVKVNPAEYGVEETKAAQIAEQFKPMLDKMVELEAEYNQIIVLPIEKETCAKAKELRNKYVKIRTGTDKIHKEQKAFYLAAGRYIDGWKNAQLFASQGIEKKLEDIEKHYENIEKEKMIALKNERFEILKSVCDNPELYTPELMLQEAFDNLVNGLKLAKQAKIESELKAEAERIERERKDAIGVERRNKIVHLAGLIKDFQFVNFSEMTDEKFNEMFSEAEQRAERIAEQNQRQSEENERLKKEAEEREAAIAKERAEAEATLAEERRLNTEREAKEKAEREEQARIEREAAEVAAKKEREEAAAKLAAEQAEKQRLENELKAKQQAEQEAKDKAAAEEEAKLSMGDAAKYQELINDLEALKSKHTFKSAKFKKAHAQVVELLDKTINFAVSKQ